MGLNMGKIMTISVGNPPSLLRFGCDEEWVKSRIHEFECELHLKVPDYSKVMIEIISAAPEQYRSGLGLAAGVATRPFLGARRFEKALQFIANAVAVLHGAVDPAEYDAAMKKLYGRGTYLKIVEG